MQLHIFPCQFLVKHLHCTSNAVTTGNEGVAVMSGEGQVVSGMKGELVNELSDDVGRLPAMNGKAESYALVFI